MTKSKKTHLQSNALKRLFSYHKRLLIPLFLGICLLGLMPLAQAEGDGDPERTTSFFLYPSTSYSDYYVQVTWSGGLPNGNCGCSQNNQYVESYIGGYYSGTRLFSHNYTNSKSSGNFTYVAGPSYSQNWYFNFRYTGKDPVISCLTPESCENKSKVTLANGDDDYENARTSRIYNPTGLDASDDESEGSLLNRIILTWNKGTDIPANQVGYKIYRNNSLIKTQAIGTTSYTFTDSLLSANTTYTYKVTTYTNDWGGDESTGATNTGKTLSLALTASEGVYTNKVRLSWNSVSTSADNIRVERSIPATLGGGYEELTILNKHAEAYTDNDVIPGFSYNYRVSPLDSDGNDLQQVVDAGWMKPNGIIKGKVISRGGAGVQNVTITVAYDGSLPSNKSPAYWCLLSSLYRNHRRRWLL